MSQLQPQFYPPRTNPFLVTLLQWLAPPVAHWHYKYDLVVSPESLERLRSLRAERAILLPNHPTFHDPPVIFMLSGLVGQSFEYLGALELFRTHLGPWLQRLGVYSIRRGTADRSSIAQTLAILSSPKCKLVVFAEGGCSFQNDLVTPFRTGAIQMAFQALHRLHKQGEALPNLYAVPISLKYHYTQDMTAIIEESLRNLEIALELPAIGDPLQRLQTIAERQLQNCEQAYNLPVVESATWDQRLANLKAYLLSACEQQLNLRSNSETGDHKVSQESLRDRAYRIQDALEVWQPEALAQNPATIWGREKIAKAAWRVLNYHAISNSYVAENPTFERFLDTLTLLERDVFEINQPKPKGPRLAKVHINEPLNLKDWFTDYQCNRLGTVTSVTQKIQQLVQHNLDTL